MQRRLSRAEIEQLIHRYREGDSIAGLARRYQVNRTTVIHHLDQAGIARRITTEPIVVRDEKLPAGSVITLATGSANRDPLQWGPTADAVDVRRENANQHASFGGGPHHCLGAALARLEGQVAIGRLVRRFGRIAPAYNEPRYEARMILRGIAELPVRPRG